MSCAQTAEPIEMPFGLRAQVGSGNHVLDGVQIPLCEGAFFLSERTYLGMPDDTAVSCAKTAELIEMPFGLWTWVGRRKHVLHGVTLAPPSEYD